MSGAARPPSAWQIGEAMSILMQARERLRTDPEIAEDADLLTDYLESDPETCDAFEQLHRLARAAIAMEDYAKLARARANEIIARARRYDQREEMLRDTLKQAMQALDIRRIQQPDFGVTLTKPKAGVKIIDETLLEDCFVKTTRTPLKREIGEALDAGEVVAGAVRGNPEPSLLIRRS